MASVFGIKPGEGHHTSISMFEDYPAQTARVSAKERKGIKKTARALFETSPSDAISYLAGQRGYTNFRPDLLMGKLMSKPIDYDRFKLVGATAFQDLLGRSMSDTEWQQASEYAKSMGVKDPNAFEALLSKRLASTPEGQAKIKSEADIAWESQYGTMPRDAQGNLVRGRVRFDPGTVNQMVNTMLGTVA
jgi:hypothetical protein